MNITMPINPLKQSLSIELEIVLINLNFEAIIYKTLPMKYQKLEGRDSGFLLKVIKFQNEFMKSSFLPKYERQIVRISALHTYTLQGRNPDNFSFIWHHKFILKFTDL